MRSFKAIAAFVLASLFATLGYAEEFAGPKKGQFYIAPGAIYHRAPDDTGGIDNGELGGGLALGANLTERLSFELFGGQTTPSFDVNGVSGEDDANFVWADFLYKLEGGNEKWTPFFILGGGRTKYNFDNVRSDISDNQYNAGVGFWRHITDRVLIRGDVRGVYSNDEGGIRPFAFLGLTGLIGAGAEPPPPPDSDGDGVIDANDQCPNTPPGTNVGADGCELDSDGDGVVDSADQCPGTPRGVAVNADGCPLDSDGDGITDDKDQCPDSEPGAQVDERGCYIELDEEITIDLNLEFDTNSAQLRTDHYPQIQSVVEFLKQFPSSSAVIEGHTDSTGAASYNQSLSERRAKSVRDYLVSDGGISGSRLSSVGFGETQPIDSNDTEEGRQRNRRVSAKVSGTQKVRQQ